VELAVAAALAQAAAAELAEAAAEVLAQAAAEVLALAAAGALELRRQRLSCCRCSATCLERSASNR